MTDTTVTLVDGDVIQVVLEDSPAIEAEFSSVARAGQGPQGKYFEEIFANAATTPSAPTGGSLVVGGAVTPPAGWYSASNLPATPDGQRPYVSQTEVNPLTQSGTVSNPTWGTPIPAGVPGPKGDTGDRAWIQYSDDGSTGWSGSNGTGTEYIRFAVAGSLPGTSDSAWSGAVQFVGEDGFSPVPQFSANGTSGWNTAPASTRPFIRFQTGTSTFTAAVRYFGADGFTPVPQFSANGTTGWNTAPASSRPFIRFQTGASSYTAGVRFFGEDGEDGEDPEDGEDGFTPVPQFSADGSTSWSATATPATDKYIRFQTAATTYTAAIKFVGDDGFNPVPQFSDDGSTGWSATLSSSNKYIRFQTGTSTYTSAVKFVADDGDDGDSVFIQYSADNSAWQNTPPTGAKYIRFAEAASRPGDASTDWSTGIELPAGPAGALQGTLNPSRIEQDGATAGQALIWDNDNTEWTPGDVAVTGVEANPDGAATDTLTKITIGDTVFEISGGGGEPSINEIIITNDRAISARSWENVIAGTATEATNTAVVQGDRFISYGAGLNTDQDFDLKAGTYLVECDLWVGSVANQRPMPMVRLTDGTDELARSTVAYVRSPATAYRLFPVVMMVTFATDQTGLEIEVGSGPDETDESSFNGNVTTQSGSAFNIGGSISRRSRFRFHRLTAGTVINMVSGDGASSITLEEDGTALTTKMERLNIIGKRVTASNDPDTPANKNVDFTLTDRDIGANTVIAKRNHDRLEDAGTYTATYGAFANAGDDQFFAHYGLQLSPNTAGFNSFAYATAVPLGSSGGGTREVRISVPHGTDLETVRVTRTTQGGGVSTYGGAGNWGKVTQANARDGVEYYEWQGSGTSNLRLGTGANDTWRMQTRTLTEVFSLDPEKLAQVGATAGQALLWDGDNDEWAPGDVEADVDISGEAAIQDLLHLTRDLHTIAPHQDWEEADDGDADLYAVINSSGDYPPTGITLTDANFAGNGPDITSGSTPHVFYAFYIRLPVATDISKFRVYLDYSSARGGNAWIKVTGPSPSTYQYFLVAQVGNYVNTRVHVQKLPDALAKTQFGGELIDDAASPAASVRELALENKSRLNSIEEIEEVVGDFANVTLKQNVAGWQFGSSTDTSDETRLDNFEFGDLTFSGTDTDRIFGISTPLGVSVSRVRLNWDGTIYPSAATNTHWQPYRPTVGAKDDRDYYFVAGDTNNAPTVFAAGSNKELDMQIAPVTHRFAVTLEALTLKAWQDDSATGAPPNGAQEETAYIQGGLIPIEFPRLTGTRHLHFEVPDNYGIDLISINGANAFADFTADESAAGVRRYHSAALANAGRIDLLIRVIRDVS